MNTNAGADAFISYSNRDKEFVLRLANALESRGLRLASALQVITVGAWREQVMEALETAPTLLFVVSPDSVRDTSCLEEFRRAEGLKKRIIPIYYRLQPRDELSVSFQSYSGVDFTEETQFDAGIEQLLAALSSTPQVEPRSVPTAGWVPIKRISENSTVPEEDPATIALARLLTKAASINQHFETNFDVTFSSMLLAFLACDDALSQWFRNYVEEAKVEVAALLETRNLSPAKLTEIASQEVPESELSRIWRQTSSARNLFAAGREFLQRTSTAQPALPIDVRHLMGAYIYRPVGHEGDLVSLNYNRVSWSNGFLGQISRLYPRELEAWKQIHRETFPDDPPEPFVLNASGAPEPVPPNGPSTHIATDLWTTEDALGYRAYAYAIYRFMTHPQTKPPLTISIQAPWGGGKTSLMRMVQEQLDPGGIPKKAPGLEAEAKQERGAITVRDALREIEAWIELKTRRQLPPTPPAAKRELLTVWFNAWKYENANQVWAGLADTIMHQIAARLSLPEREKFWLRLNLRRIDADKLRQRIHERVVRYWWRAMRVLLFVMAGVVAAGFLLTLLGGLVQQGWLARTGWGGVLISTLGSAIYSVLKFNQAREAVNQEPAAISLSEYLEIPDYNKELGFIHHVEADLRRVLESVPVTEENPLVIFVDDLDRCSPGKVAQVVEAVNLFLAGDFPNCMFVLGMDAEMVAAALQAAHKDMIAHLPEDAGIPVGWRFMDKFVQLPFLIPPTVGASVSTYTRALFASEAVQLVETEAQRLAQLAQEAAARIVTRTTNAPKDYDEEAQQVRTQHNLNEDGAAYVRQRIEAQVVQRRLDDGFEKFNDRNDDIIRVIETTTKYFSGNPREMKRFVNAFRFHFFLWWARRAQGMAAPSLEQLTRWTVLCMRWPEVVRWLRRGGGNELVASPQSSVTDSQSALTFQSRLRLLEELSGKSNTLLAWHETAKNDLRLNVEKTAWLGDEDLFQFFRDEQAQAIGHRLSDGAGQGLW